MRPLFATIDSAALRHNLGVVRRHASRSKGSAVVKADAYGHGLLRAAAALSQADSFALIELEGAVQLREAGFKQPIVLLEGFFEARELPLLVKHGFSTVVHAMEQVEALDALADGARLDVLLKANTGMNRLGLAQQEFSRALELLRKNKRICLISLLTHFASADEARGAGWQMQTLRQFAGAADLPKSLANSAAVLRYPETHADWVRPGIMLYGCSPFPGRTGAE